MSPSTPRAHSAFGYARRITRDVWVHPSNRHHRARALARAVGWQVSKRVGRRPHDVAFWGLTLRCYPDSNSASNVMYFGERYDPDEMRFMERYLRPGDGYIDVGANIGTYTLVAASLVGPAGRIEAFEPFPPAASRLRENVALNHLEGVTVHEVATSDRAGTVEFLTDYDVSNCVRNDTDRAGTVIRVPQETVDAVLGDHRYALGKIDVEGLELASFRGAERHLLAANPPVWQLEVLDHQLRKYGASAAALLEHLEARGFDIAGYGPDGTPTFDRGHWSGQRNLLAVARSARDEVIGRVEGAGPPSAASRTGEARG